MYEMLSAKLGKLQRRKPSELRKSLALSMFRLHIPHLRSQVATNTTNQPIDLAIYTIHQFRPEWNYFAHSADNCTSVPYFNSIPVGFIIRLREEIDDEAENEAAEKRARTLEKLYNIGKPRQSTRIRLQKQLSDMFHENQYFTGCRW